MTDNHPYIIRVNLEINDCCVSLISSAGTMGGLQFVIADRGEALCSTHAGAAGPEPAMEAQKASAISIMTKWWSGSAVLQRHGFVTHD